MSSQQKRGFRLPWAGEREPGENAGASTLENGQTPPVRLDLLRGAVGDGLGEGPFHFAEEATPPQSTDAAPDAPDVPETTAEAAMIDTESGTTEVAETATATDPDAGSTTDQDAVAEATAEPAETTAEADEAPVDPDALIGEADVETPAPATPKTKSERDQRATPPTRSNPLVAGLIKAMREAAIASRAEETSRLQAEATARVEAIRTDATEESAALRKRVDEDIAGIRDWSKGEMSRIRQQTEERIEGRRTDAIAENDRHTAHVEYLVSEVQARVEAFEADMDRFFERLLAENDPAALAALAEQAPEPPDLTEETVSEAESEAEATANADEWQGIAWTNPGLEADAAAEAEAEATEGLDLSSDEQWPASVLAAARRNDTPDEDAPTGAGNSRLFVNGLTSVAGISAFKGAVGQLPGVTSVSVSSGEPGVFIFAVAHSPEVDLQAEIAGLTQFSTRVTEASGDSLTVSAHEPAA